MRKIIFTILISLIGINTFATDNHKIIKATDSQKDTHYYYYDKDNCLIWELYGTTRREYSYNEAGQLSSLNQMAWVSGDGNYTVNQIENYEYDANGNIEKKTVVKSPGTSFESTWTYIYSDYVNGVATYYDEYKNGKLYYMYKQAPEYDAQGRLVKCVVYYADPDDYKEPTHETVNYDSKDYEYTKTWGEDGYLAAENNGKTEITYEYTDLNATYTPANMNAILSESGVSITWSAVEGAEKYIVSYDQERKEVTGTSFSVVVQTGSRPFSVQAVIDGIERNASFAVAQIIDPGKLPVTDLAVGEMTRTEEETESEEAPIRVFYNIPLSWTLPEGHSEISKINIYYDSDTYGKDFYVSTGKDATSYTLKVDPFEVAEKNEEGELVKGIDTPIYVRIVYVTGESEKSNIIIVNPYDTLETGIDAISVAPVFNSNKIYTIDGKPAKTNMKGIVIMNGKKIRK